MTSEKLIQGIASIIEGRGEGMLDDEGVDWQVCVEVAEDILNYLEHEKVLR